MNAVGPEWSPVAITGFSIAIAFTKVWASVSQGDDGCKGEGEGEGEEAER